MYSSGMTPFFIVDVPFCCINQLRLQMLGYCCVSKTQINQHLQVRPMRLEYKHYYWRLCTEVETCRHTWRAQVKVGLIHLCKGLFSLNARIYYKLKRGT